MKRSILIFLLLFTGGASFPQTTAARKKMNEIALKYFKTDFKGLQAKDILIGLIDNMDIRKDTIIAQTDTSTFYFRGFSDTYNPFTFQPMKLELEFREGGLMIRGEQKPRDTLLYIQLIAIVDSSSKGLSLLEQEIKSLHKKTMPFFSYYVEGGVKKADQYPSHGYSYYSRPVTYPLVSAGWGPYYADRSKYCLTLSLVYDTY